MTWHSDIEVGFKHDGQEHYASADVVVTLKKEDIGPVGYLDHFESYVTQVVEVENLLVGDFGESIPEPIQHAAYFAIQEEASRKAEEAME